MEILHVADGVINLPCKYLPIAHLVLIPLQSGQRLE